MLFEERDGEGFFSRSSEDSLGGKVKQKWVVVVEFIQCSTLSSCDETNPEGRREGEREGERVKEGRRGGSG